MASLENSVPGTQDHQMESLEREEGQSQLQLKVEELKRKYLSSRPGSPDYMSLAEAGLALLAMGIDSVETAEELGIKFNTNIDLRGGMNLRDFVVKALEATLLEEKSVPVSMPMAWVRKVVVASLTAS